MRAGHSNDRPTYRYGVGLGSRDTRRYLLDEFGDEMGGAGRAVGLNVAVADGLSGQLGDQGGAEVGVGGGVVHGLAGSVTGQSVVVVEVLLEAVPGREVEVRS